MRLDLSFQDNSFPERVPGYGYVGISLLTVGQNLIYHKAWEDSMKGKEAQ